MLKNTFIGDPLKNQPVYAASTRPLSEPIRWTREQCFTTNGGPATYTQKLFNQSGAVS